MIKKRSEIDSSSVPKENASSDYSAMALAKLTVPATERAYPRIRLFKQLDRIRASANIIWITAQAGAGKTTLAASYLKDRDMKGVWYQLDEGDTDPASFFYYLAQAAQPLIPHTPPLPALTPEYLGGQSMFTRNFFREFFARYRGSGVLVLDNYQDLPDTSPLHGLLATGFDETPHELTVVVLSRELPPRSFARMQANGRLAVIEGTLLNLAIDEIQEIVALQEGLRISDDDARGIEEKIRGWTAGLILMLQQPESVLSDNAAFLEHTPQTVFDYFASEVFSSLKSETQAFLLKSALLPEIRSSVARALTGHPCTEELLADLHRRNCFTTVHAKERTLYQYHPLFREFLRKQARRQLDPCVIQDLQSRAGALLAQSGDREAAVNLLLDSEQAKQAIPLILEQAESLVRHGRQQVLNAWLQQLSAEFFDHIPWLLYWRAVTAIPFDCEAAKRDFIRAFGAFKAGTEDHAGLYLSCAGVIQIYLLVWNEFATLDCWLDEMTELLKRYPHFPSPAVEAMATTAMTTALLLRQPQNPELHVWLGRTEAIFEDTEIPGLKMEMARTLMFCYPWLGHLGRFEHMLQTTRSYAEDPQVNPLDRFYWWVAHAMLGWLKVNTAQWHHGIKAALTLIQESGLSVPMANLQAQGVYGNLSEGDLPAAGRYLEAMEQATNFSSHMDASQYYYLAAWAALQRSDYPEARSLGEQQLRITEATGVAMLRALSANLQANILFAMGECSEAWTLLEAGWRMAKVIDTPILAMQFGCSRAIFLAHEGNETKAVAVLRKVLASARHAGLMNYPGWCHNVMSHLCLLALRHEVEVDYVCLLIRKRNLLPPEDALVPETWPFALRLHTLGRFAIVKDGQALQVSGKLQKKPLALLQVLVAFGGRDVAEDRIAGALWPDAEGDTARSALRTTLHRLRKLLGNDEAVASREGHLTLNRRCWWVDVWAVERLVSETEPRLKDPSLTAEVLLPIVDSLKRWYQGSFLVREAEVAWMLPLRERLRSRVIRLLRGLIGGFARCGDCQQVIELYETALQLDDLYEDLYRGLMACYASQGRRTEALAVYERCTYLLQEVLGICPSAETERLHDALLAADLRLVEAHCQACRAAQPH